MQRNRLLLPVPFTFWYLLARLASVTSNPPLTTDQVELMRHDNIADSNLPGFKELEIEPRNLEPFLASYLAEDRDNDRASL